jgi:hypothetical protein
MADIAENKSFERLRATGSRAELKKLYWDKKKFQRVVQPGDILKLDVEIYRNKPVKFIFAEFIRWENCIFIKNCPGCKGQFRYRDTYTNERKTVCATFDRMVKVTEVQSCKLPDRLFEVEI